VRAHLLCSCSSGPPSENYWQLLAEKRRIALEESLQENKILHERLQILEEEKQLTEQMLEESRNLVDVLKVSSVMCHE
jgi:geminin